MKCTQETAQYWRRHVQAYERSGETRKTYCSQNQLKIHQLDYWRRKLRNQGLPPKTAATGWIPLEIQEDRVPEHASKICLRIGRVAIEVGPGFDRELLADVLRVVGPTC